MIFFEKTILGFGALIGFCTSLIGFCTYCVHCRSLAVAAAFLAQTMWTAINAAVYKEILCLL